MTDRSTPPLRATRRSLPIALLRAREVVMGPVREMLAKSGVNEQKWRVLRVLAETGPIELTTLAHSAVLLLPSLTRMIRALEDDALILRKVPLTDRRKVVVEITPKARDLLTTHAKASQAIVARIEAGFGHDRLEILLDLLEDLQKLDFRGQGG